MMEATKEVYSKDYLESKIYEVNKQMKKEKKRGNHEQGPLR